MRTVLVVSTRLTARRRAALERLVGTEVRPEFLDPADTGSSLHGAEVAAVVFDGRARRPVMPRCRRA